MENMRLVGSIPMHFRHLARPHFIEPVLKLVVGCFASRFDNINRMANSDFIVIVVSTHAGLP